MNVQTFTVKYGCYGFGNHSNCRPGASTVSERGRLRAYFLDPLEDRSPSARDEEESLMFRSLKDLQFSFAGFSNENIIYK